MPGTTSTSSSLEHDAPVQKFYVCFSNAGEYRFHKLFRRGFTHVSIFEKLEGVGYIAHDPNRYALDTYILPESSTDEFLKRFLELRPDYTIVEVVKRATLRKATLMRVGLQSCVTVVAYIVGIKMPFYKATPHSLYKTLKRGGQGIISSREINHGFFRNRRSEESAASS